MGCVFKLSDQCSFSSKPTEGAKISGPGGKPSAPVQQPVSVVLTWSSPAKQGTSRKPSSPTIQASDAAVVSPAKLRSSAYYIKKKAEAAARMQQRSKDAAAKKKTDLIAKTSAAKAKLRTTASDLAAKEKAEIKAKSLQVRIKVR